MSVDTMPLSIRADHVRVASWQAIRARMMPISTQQCSATSATAAPMFASATPYPRHCMSAGTRAVSGATRFRFPKYVSRAPGAYCSLWARGTYRYFPFGGHFLHPNRDSSRGQYESDCVRADGV